MIRVVPMTREQAMVICSWRYESPYDVYNFSDWETVVENEWDLAHDGIREKHFVSLFEQDQWIGFGRLSPFEDKVDIGIGLKPDLCGKGHGLLTMLALVLEARKRYPMKVPSLMVRQFNERAIKSYESCGFLQTGHIDWPVHGEGKVPFIQMSLKPEAILPKVYAMSTFIAQLPPVQAVGISGGFKTLTDRSKVSDLDLFIYCSETLSGEERQSVFEAFSSIYPEAVTHMTYEAPCSPYFGSADQCLVDGIDTWLMYFDSTASLKEVEAFQLGLYPDRLDNYFYATGRLDLFLNMGILSDPTGMLGQLKGDLRHYPKPLKDSLIRFHSSALEDIEDLERAVSRRDVFFYHFALDLALDHFLQVLFAVNETYFPSRKRSDQFLTTFKMAPRDCSSRLKEVVRLGAEEGLLDQSFEGFKQLTEELMQILEDSI